MQPTFQPRKSFTFGVSIVVAIVALVLCAWYLWAPSLDDTLPVTPRPSPTPPARQVSTPSEASIPITSEVIRPLPSEKPESTRQTPATVDERKVAEEVLVEVRRLLAEEELKKARTVYVRAPTWMSGQEHLIEIDPLDPAVVDAAHAQLSKGLALLPSDSRAREYLTFYALSIVRDFAKRLKPKRFILIQVHDDPATNVYLGEYQVDEMSDFIDPKTWNRRMTIGEGPGQTIPRDGYFGDEGPRKWVSERYSHFLETLPEAAASPQ